MTIGENIKRIRKEKKIKQKQLADAIGVSVTAMQGFEYDKYKPSQDNVLKIASYLDVEPSDIDELLKFDPKKVMNDIQILEQVRKHFEINNPLVMESLNDFLNMDESHQIMVAEYIDFIVNKHCKKE